MPHASPPLGRSSGQLGLPQGSLGEMEPSCLPLLLQSAFSQLRLTPGLRKVLFATALGTVALALAAHQLKRRRRRKKQVGPEMGGEHLGTVPLPILMARKVPSVKKGRCEVVGKGLTWSYLPAGPLLTVGSWASDILSPSCVRPICEVGVTAEPPSLSHCKDWWVMWPMLVSIGDGCSCYQTTLWEHPGPERAGGAQLLCPGREVPRLGPWNGPSFLGQMVFSSSPSFFKVRFVLHTVRVTPLGIQFHEL